MKRAFLSLGSNRGERRKLLAKALDNLGEAGVQVLRVSSCYKTEPVDFQPQSWFVNCVAEVQTDLMPLRLLRVCKSVERALGRRLGVSRGPRPLDIDILLYEDVVIRSRELTVPHPRMAERRFVLVPLCELAPSLRHPLTQRSIREMLHETGEVGHVIRLRQGLGSGNACNS